MNQPSNTPPQSSFILRLLAGVYLVYLAWDMRSAFADGLLYLIPAILFALVGAILFGHSLWTLIRHDYFKKSPVPEAESTKDWEESSNE